MASARFRGHPAPPLGELRRSALLLVAARVFDSVVARSAINRDGLPVIGPEAFETPASREVGWRRPEDGVIMGKWVCYRENHGYSGTW